MSIKVILVEDHELTRKGILYGLKPYTDIKVTGEFENGKLAMDFMKTCTPENTPDAILMDIAMPILNGIEAAKRIRTINPDVKIIMLTSIDERETVLQAFNCGANAYAMKNISTEKLVDVIKMVMNGEVWIAPSIANYILEALSGFAPIDDTSKTSNNFNLTNREKEILTLISKGMNNKDIANKLVISLYTVKNHVKSIIQKLAVEDRTQAAILALKENIV
ncbi:MAG: response regulator transcription factor [Candidatus Gastranaerophilales bacterium]|nr:response regulator transcription factor [Candidatus Gastranaerophilales bacterium]